MKKALMVASVASMIDLFNMDNIRILQEMGYEVHVAANFEKGSVTSQERVQQFWKELEQNNIKVIHVPIPRSPFSIRENKQSYRILKNLIQENQYSLVHCHTPIGGALARLAAKWERKNGTKVIYSAHGFHFFKGAPFLNWLLYYPAEKWLAHMTDVLITICEEDFQRAKKFRAGRIEYIPGVGIDTEKIATCSVDRVKKRRDLGIPEDATMILSVGEVNKNKNQEVIVRAIAELKNSRLYYVVCGQGPRKEMLENLAKELKIEKQVLFLGYRKDIYEMNQTADIFAFPSYREGLPVSLMEAMAAGLPVVCSKIRGNVDLIEQEKGGFLLEPKDVRGFSAFIQKLDQEEQTRKNMGQYNSSTVKHFDKKDVNKKMKQIYEN